MNVKLKMTWQEVFVTFFRVQSPHCPIGIVALNEALKSEPACSVYLMLAVGIGSSYKTKWKMAVKKTTI
jgi:hypothetical protein